MRFTACLLAVMSVGCSWSRYDDVSGDSPIVLLNKPKGVSEGFGSSLATATFEADGETYVRLLAGGAPLRSGGAEFELGTSDNPTIEATDGGHCLGGEVQCYFSSTPVPLARAKTSGNSLAPLCFIDGAGVASREQGLVARCTGDTDHEDVEYTLALPDKAASLLNFSIDNAQPTPFRFGVDQGPDPLLLATADEEREVWFYPSLSNDFVEVQNPADSKGWTRPNRRTLAVARVGGDARLLAVGEPDTGTVRLFSVPDGVTPVYVGCLGGTPEFGRTLATGPVKQGDDEDELVIADHNVVYVFDGARLAELPEASDTACSLGALPPDTLVTSFSCGSSKNISGCASSEFGAALAVGDLDGDGDGEVVVGAPAMTVRHLSRAGALLIYDVDKPQKADEHLYDFKDIAFLSSADADDGLGSSIALPRIDGRQIIAAGAPSGGKVALFYCPLPGLSGSRCN